MDLTQTVTFTKVELLPNIYHLHFNSQRELASTFLRFQEHYESPKFAGKVFSLEEFKQWYSIEKGEFSYYTDWNGFNVPAPILIPFYQGKFDPLLKREQQVLDSLRSEYQQFITTKKPFYVVGTTVDNPTLIEGTLKHEIAHGFYYLFKAYKELVHTILHSVSLARYEQYLLKKGYAPQVILDEVQAILIADATPEDEKHPTIAKAIRALHVVFDIYLEKLQISKD